MLTSEYKNNVTDETQNYSGGLGSMNVREVEEQKKDKRSYGGIIGSFGTGAGYRYTPDSDSD